MNVEQIAGDFITKMNDVNAAESYLTPDAMAAGGVLPKTTRPPCRRYGVARTKVP
jgi:hypothetical protein